MNGRDPSPSARLGMTARAMEMRSFSRALNLRASRRAGLTKPSGDLKVAAPCLAIYDVQGTLPDGERRFLDRFAERWV
jgi:hypothetical protein